MQPKTPTLLNRMPISSTSAYLKGAVSWATTELNVYDSDIDKLVDIVASQKFLCPNFLSYALKETFLAFEVSGEVGFISPSNLLRIVGGVLGASLKVNKARKKTTVPKLAM
jgi:hypothetical protein